MAEEAPGTHQPRPSPSSRFTALELAAAEHLIHLSESCSSSAAAPPGAFSVGSGAASSCSSSLRSVNAPPPRVLPPPPPPPAAAEEDDEEDEVGGRCSRRNKRYRPIAEIYAATDPKPQKPRPILELGCGRKDKGNKDKQKQPSRPKVPAAGVGKTKLQEPRVLRGRE